jgi:hypothetical protein
VDVPVVAKPSHDPGFSRYYFKTNIQNCCMMSYLQKSKRDDLLIKEKADK